VGNSVTAHPNDSSLQRHLADSLDDLQQFLEGRRTDVFQKKEIGDEEIVRQNQVMDGHGMRSFRSEALPDVELHPFVANTLERSVNGAI
jgi:hypothetical protein